jgi:small-conductance mechanosensitive channel
LFSRSKERLAEMESTVENLRSLLTQGEAQAQAESEKWKERYGLLELQKVDLEQKLEMSDESKSAQLQETLKNLDDFSEKLKEDEVVVEQWQGKLKRTTSNIHGVGVSDASLLFVGRTSD